MGIQRGKRRRGRKGGGGLKRRLREGQQIGRRGNGERRGRNMRGWVRQERVEELPVMFHCCVLFLHIHSILSVRAMHRAPGILQ